MTFATGSYGCLVFRRSVRKRGHYLPDKMGASVPRGPFVGTAVFLIGFRRCGFLFPPRILSKLMHREAKASGHQQGYEEAWNEQESFHVDVSNFVLLQGFRRSVIG